MSEIFLIRHGQVALDGAGYDGLSPLGERQAEAVGRALGARGVSVSRVVVGSMKRHHQTALWAGRAAGWSTSEEVRAGWDEVDHVAILAATGDGGPAARSLSGPDTLRRFFGEAIPRWTSGLHDADYPETFAAFTDRVTNSFDQLRRQLDDEEAAIVFTSAGVLGRIAVSLIGAGEKQWLSLIPAACNGGITRIRLAGARASLVSYNEHGHLRPEEITYR